MRFEQSNRCGNCGCTDGYDSRRLSVLVTDWRTDYLCDVCFASYTWLPEDWEFTAPESAFSLPRYRRRSHDRTTAVNVPAPAG